MVIGVVIIFYVILTPAISEDIKDINSKNVAYIIFLGSVISPCNADAVTVAGEAR